MVALFTRDHWVMLFPSREFPKTFLDAIGMPEHPANGHSVENPIVAGVRYITQKKVNMMVIDMQVGNKIKHAVNWDLDDNEIEKERIRRNM